MGKTSLDIVLHVEWWLCCRANQRDKLMMVLLLFPMPRFDIIVLFFVRMVGNLATVIFSLARKKALALVMQEEK